MQAGDFQNFPAGGCGGGTPADGDEPARGQDCADRLKRVASSGGSAYITGIPKLFILMLRNPRRFRRSEKIMSNAPLMPKATAVWLVENTALTFRQIADYCNLHEL